MRVTALPALVGRARPPATVTTGQRGLPEPEQATPGAAQVDGHVQCLRSVPLDDDREPLEPPGQDQQVPQTDTGTPWHKIPGTDPRHHATPWAETDTPAPASAGGVGWGRRWRSSARRRSARS